MRILTVAAAALIATLTATPALASPTINPPKWPNPGPTSFVTEPTLTGRATFSADLIVPGPPSGAKASPANGRKGPFPGQVIPGFSGLVDNGDGTFLGLPDNGFGAKGNSDDFLLRLYTLTPQWETGQGGSGKLEVGSYISLRDPHKKVPFKLVHNDTAERLLTGADFDVESVQRMADGTFWIGEEFGPYLLHFSADGVLLEAPVPFVDGKSPSSPELKDGEKPNVGSSRGFEAMALGRDGVHLYPIVEGSLNDDPRKDRRWIYEFDTRTKTYTGKKWAYQTHNAANVIGDAFMNDKGQIELIERDDFDGAAAVTKRVYAVDLETKDADGFSQATLLIDFLKIRNPREIGVKSTGGYGVANPFAYPFQCIEIIVRLKDGSYVSINDNNYPGNAARKPGTPDDVEMIRFEMVKRPVVGNAKTIIGHRGASGYRPEHTLASYEQAILQCADYIEPDVVPTKDGKLVARHENEIGGTTNVAEKPEFAARKATKSIDGEQVTGWFTEDFTLAELKTLRAKERLPQYRGTAFDGKYEVPTLDEVILLAKRSRTCDGRQVGVYPETKHPTYFAKLGLGTDEGVVAALKKVGWDKKNSPAIIQSFEVANLKKINTLTDTPLAQLIDCSKAPYDFVVAGDKRTYVDLATSAGLKEIATYADGVGVCNNVLIPRTADGSLGQPSSVIRDAHTHGLIVHSWTMRTENDFLPLNFRSSVDGKAHGDMVGYARAMLRAGADGYFTDFPDLGVEAANVAMRSVK